MKRMQKIFPRYKNLIQNIKRHLIPLRIKLINRERKILNEKNKKYYQWGLVIFMSTIASYCYFNSEYYNISNMSIANINKKLMSIDCNHACVIVFVEDKKLDNQLQCQVKTIQKKLITKILVKEKRKIKKQLQDKFGKTITVLSPTSIDQLGVIIQKCNNYKYSVLLGNYPLPTALTTHQINQILKSVKLPNNKQKYIIVNLQELNNIYIDNINDVVTVQTGALCRQLNKQLEKKGFKPIFQDFYGNISLYDVIANNLPLTNNQNLMSKLHNLTLISIDGRKFKSSTEVESYGKTPNLTSLFVGSGGALAAPIVALLKIQRKPFHSSKKSYAIEISNPSQLVQKWKQILQQTSSQQNSCIIKKLGNKLIIKTDQSSNLCNNKGFHQYHDLNINGEGISDFMFIVNKSIVENLLLNTTIQFQFSVSNSVLAIKNNNLLEIQKIVGIVYEEGGRLIWCRDRNGYNIIPDKNPNPNKANTTKIIDKISNRIDPNNIFNLKLRKQKYTNKKTRQDITFYI